MNAHTKITRAALEAANAWYLKSGIIPCDTCDGKGGRWRNFYGHANDPDNWVVECPDCDGRGHHACEVCGFDVHVPGFDCLVCDMVLELPADLLTDETADAMAGAVKAAVAAARASHQRRSA